MYMDAAFNNEAESAEIFMHFEDKVWDNKLIQQLEKLGACQVFVTTFTNNDGNESAANALVRVWTTAEKYGYQLIKGVCPDPLLSKAKAKYNKALQEPTDTWSKEKIQAAINMSIAGMETKIDNVDGKVDNVGGKIDNFEGKIDNMHDGVCNIIPDYQKELKELKEKLTHKTKEVDRIEYQKGLVTKERNQLREKIYEIQDETNEFKSKNQILERELEDKSEIIKAKDALIDSLQYISDIVRDAKRARTTE